MSLTGVCLQFIHSCSFSNLWFDDSIRSVVIKEIKIKPVVTMSTSMEKLYWTKAVLILVTFVFINYGLITRFSYVAALLENGKQALGCPRYLQIKGRCVYNYHSRYKGYDFQKMLFLIRLNDSCSKPHLLKYSLSLKHFIPVLNAKRQNLIMLLRY